MQNIKKTFFQTISGLKQMIPMLLGIIILVAMFKQAGIFESLAEYINDDFLGVIISDIFGSVSLGNTINSYIIANSFGNISEYILVISAFLIAWVSVGIIQLPAESYFFGKKFAIIRNLISFVFAVVGAYLIWWLY